MASSTEAEVSPPLVHPEPEPISPSEWYDRSSITVDAMVTIEGQAEEDWWRLAPENRFCEYIDGIIYMPSPVSDEHQDVAGFLFDLLNGFRHERGTGPVRMGPGVLRLGPGRNPEPDVFVLPAAGGPEVPALLVVEVLSPSTRSHDLNKKAEIYRDAAIPESWFVDRRDRVLIVHRRVGDGYQMSRISEGTLSCSSLPGFWIDVSWLWSIPLANPRRCLEAILAGFPGGAP